MEKEILNLFLYNRNLKFNEIEKKIGERSNKLAYHMKNLVKKGVLAKEGDFYRLSKENIIPYLSKKNHILPVVLIHIGNEKECFLHKRDKKPFKDLLGLPGGRIVVKENIEDAVKRVMKEKHNINAKLSKVNSVSIEHIKNSKDIIQTDLIIFVTAKAIENLKYTSIEENRSKMVSSDYRLLKEHLNKEAKIEKFLTMTN